MNRKPFHSVVDPDNPLIVWASHQEMRRAKAKAAKAKAGK